MRHFLADLLVAFLRLVTRVFFRTIEVVGLEHIPADGPVIFAGNHPNSLLDPVLITTTCRRRVRFAAKDVLFESMLLRPLLWVLGAVPIRRRQDHGAQGAIDNADAFAALLAVLARGEAFGIFPEGISHARPELAPLKTGAARIALQAAAAGTRVCIVPCGLSYRRRDRMRTRVLVQFGAPIVVEPVPALPADSESVRVLTREVELALRALTVNAPDFDTLRVLDGVRRLYRPKGLSLTLSEEAELTRRLVSHWEKLKGNDDVAALYRAIEAYQLKLRALGLTDADVHVGPVAGITRALYVVRHLLFLLVLLPLAAPGLVLYAPVLATAVVAGSSLTTRGDVRATIKMVAVTCLVFMAYGVVGVAVCLAAPGPSGLVAAVATIAALMASGWATIRVLEKQSELRRSLSTLMCLVELETELLRLVAEREGLRARLLEIVDQHFDDAEKRVIAREHHDDVAPWLDDDDAD